MRLGLHLYLFGKEYVFSKMRLTKDVAFAETLKA